MRRSKAATFFGCRPSPIGRPPATIARDGRVPGCAHEASAQQLFGFADGPEVPDHLATDAVDVELVADGHSVAADRDPPSSIVAHHRDTTRLAGRRERFPLLLHT
jgi:hypothetical protein